MIIWRGWGLAAFGLIFGCSLVANLITNAVTGDVTYWTKHGWPFACAMISAGGAIWWLDAALGRRAPRQLVDADTGARVTLPSPHDLFFIPLRYWAAICGVLGLIILLTGWAPGESPTK